MAQPLPSPPLLMAQPLVEDFFAASLREGVKKLDYLWDMISKNDFLEKKNSALIRSAGLKPFF